MAGDKYLHASCENPFALTNKFFMPLEFHGDNMPLSCCEFHCLHFSGDISRFVQRLPIFYHSGNLHVLLYVTVNIFKCLCLSVL